MIGRVRDVRDKEITVLLENHYCRCSITKQNIEQDLVDGRNELLSLTFKGELLIKLFNVVSISVRGLLRLPVHRHVFPENTLLVTVCSWYFGSMPIA